MNDRINPRKKIETALMWLSKSGISIDELQLIRNEDRESGILVFIGPGFLIEGVGDDDNDISKWNRNITRAIRRFIEALPFLLEQSRECDRLRLKLDEAKNNLGAPGGETR